MNTYNTRLVKTFDNLRKEKKKALIPFITTGDPQHIDIVDLMIALVKGGANIIELGIPFSEAVADGAIIQDASKRAIAAGISYHDCFAAIKKFRQYDNKTPIIIMSYLNPTEVHTYGFAGFAKDSKLAGADGIILVDLSYESGLAYRKILRKNNLDLIPLIAPTTSKTRLGKIVKNAGGFVYYISMRGTTGNDIAINTKEISQSIYNIYEKTDLPICIGFGINSKKTAKIMANFADGIIVGSALVKKLYNAAQDNENVLTVASDFMQSLRQTLDN